MKKILFALMSIGLITLNGNANVGDKIKVGGNFEAKVIAEGLEFPWAMTYGKDGKLWITERQGKHITKVDINSGELKRLHTIVNAHIGPQHEGVLGLAFAPKFLEGDNTVYTAYTYKEGNNEYARIVSFKYDAKKETLSNEKILIDKLPGSEDHNSGRLVLGPDNKLYYTIGDQGNNQLKRKDFPIVSQNIATAEEVAKKDYRNYPGSTLRLNLDGSIPVDNPIIKGVRSHIYTYGHRNAQGLVFANGMLYSNEHGPNSDDEINILVPGGNYGWPNVAGYIDDNSYKYVDLSTNKEYKETEFVAENYQDPIKTFYTVGKNHNFTDNRNGMQYMSWPTIAPSSIAYYPKDGAYAAWRNSLLVTSLKNGALYVIPLSDDGKQAQGDVFRELKSASRYRMVVVSPDTKKIYIATDGTGNVVGNEGKATNQFDTRNSIIEIELVK